MARTSIPPQVRPYRPKFQRTARQSDGSRVYRIVRRPALHGRRVTGEHDRTAERASVPPSYLSRPMHLIQFANVYQWGVAESCQVAHPEVASSIIDHNQAITRLSTDTLPLSKWSPGRVCARARWTGHCGVAAAFDVAAKARRRGRRAAEIKASGAGTLRQQPSPMHRGRRRSEAENEGPLNGLQTADEAAAGKWSSAGAVAFELVGRRTYAIGERL